MKKILKPGRINKPPQCHHAFARRISFGGMYCPTCGKNIKPSNDSGGSVIAQPDS